MCSGIKCFWKANREKTEYYACMGATVSGLHHRSMELMWFVAHNKCKGQVLTVWAAELGDGLDEALVQVGRPPQPRFGVLRQHHPSHRRCRGAVPRPFHPLEHASDADPWTADALLPRPVDQRGRSSGARRRRGWYATSYAAATSHGCVSVGGGCATARRESGSRARAGPEVVAWDFGEARGGFPMGMCARRCDAFQSWGGERQRVKKASTSTADL
jgi:hypothetical protein